jgi:hypothetical protein
MKNLLFITFLVFVFPILSKAQVAPSGGTNLQYNESAGPHDNTAPFTYTYTAGTGANRLMVLVITHESQAANQSNDIASVTYGGQSLIQAANINVGGTPGTLSNRIAIYHLKESEIAAASNTTVTINYTTASNLKGVGVSTIMLINVNQIRPVESSRTNSGGAVTSLAAPTSFFAEVNNYVIAGTVAGGSGTAVTASTSYTHSHNNTVATSSHKHSYSSKAITAGANETPGFTFSTADRAAFASIEVNNILFPVPVQLVSFNATKANNAVTLNWKVGVESNIQQYVIERMKEGDAFAPIATISAVNIDNSIYNYVDNNPHNGNSFYRLKIIENNNPVKYSNTLLVKGTSLSKPIVNSPFINTINVLIPSAQRETAIIALTTVDGKILLRENRVLATGLNSFTIQPPSSLHSGIYFLTIERSGNREVLRLIK